MLFLKFFLVSLIAWTQLQTQGQHMRNNQTQGQLVRKKRIVRGEVITNRDTGYDGLLFYVYIGNAHRCSIIHQGTEHQYCEPTAENTRCGGSLVTQRIVLTAAHCLGYLKDKDDDFMGMVMLNHWENLMECYVGYSDLDLMRRGAFSKFFLIANGYTKTKNPPFVVSFDFGWIILRHAVDTQEDLVPSAQRPWIYVPLYTRAHLERIWSSVLEERSTCLIVGFGSWSFNFETKTFEMVGSDKLRHGWVTTFSEETCRWLVWDRHEEDSKNPAIYEQLPKTWSCHGAFGKNYAFIGDKDGGSPMTCNNRPFGVATVHEEVSVDGSGPTWYTISHGLQFIAYQSAAEHRASFIADIENYKPNYEAAREFIPQGLQA